tara:strand:- start:178 stop:1623 length:1446 start_codon:yes stop_codon:yes gene_type:complete
MVKYSSDTNLIRGAGQAYRDYSNAPGIYAGLDKISEASERMTDKAISAAEKQVERDKKEKEEQEAISNTWNSSADKVLLESGAVSEVLYDFTVSETENNKSMYIDGVNSKDNTKRLGAMKNLNNHSLWVQDHKQTNLDYASMISGKNPDGSDAPELSDYFTKTEQGREDAYTIDQIMGKKYKKVSRNEDNDIVFHITDKDGNEKLVTSKEYANLGIPKNYSVTDALDKNLAQMKRSEVVDVDIVKQRINKSLPNNDRDFIALMHDDVSGQNLKTMLTNRGSNLDQEIIASIDPKAWDTDPEGTAGVLDPTERANFIDAVVNPKNQFFDINASKQIMADQLFNGVMNKHKQYWDAKNEKANAKTGTGKEYRNYTIDGYTGINYATAKKQYDNMLIAGKANYDRKGVYKYVSNGKGFTEVSAQGDDGKYKKIEIISTNEALARRGLDLFGSGTEIEKVGFTKFDPSDGMKKDEDFRFYTPSNN